MSLLWKPTRRKTHSLCFSAVACLWASSLAATADPAPPRGVRLRNNLSAGVRTVYSLTIRTKRSTAPSDDQEAEILVYEQSGRLTLFGLSPPERSRADRAWMLELDEARPEELTRQGEPILPLPEPADLGLPPRAAQLRVDQATPLDAYAAVAGGSPVERAALLLALDVIHWPERQITAGEQWARSVDHEHLSGERTFTLTEVRGKGRKREAVVTSSVSGEFRDELQGSATLTRAEVSCVWHVSEKSLLDLESTVELSYTPQRQKRRMTVEVKLERVSHRKVGREERRAIAEELDELTEAVGTYRRGDRDAAVLALRDFESNHPRSMWLPVTRDLMSKAKYEQETLVSLSDEQLSAVLVQLITKWQGIAITDSPERLQPLRTTFAELVDTQREGLRRIVAGNEASMRAIAVFCFAFGSEEEDRRILVERARDDDGLVRAWAVYGLAERGEPDRDADLLYSALSDDDARVRQRACMAVRACILSTSGHRARFADRLIEMVAGDEHEDVRTLAAVSLARLAQRRHLGRLRAIRQQEQAAPVRDLLERVIRQVNSQPTDGPE